MRKLMHLLMWCAPLLLLLSCETEENKRLPVIIDADTANEIDDLYAIVRALSAPELDIIAINSAQFHTSPLASKISVMESHVLNEQIIKLAGTKNKLTILGSNIPLKNTIEPSNSEASDLIVAEAKKYSPDNPLNLVILGPCTNVASALLQDPSIIPNIHVHYIGFWHDTAQGTFDKNEFNSGNDTNAVNVLLNTKGLRFDVMTATTCQHLVFSREENEAKLSNKGEVGQLLINRWDNYERWWTREDPEKRDWIMWDVAIIEALIHPEWATIEEFDTPKENTARKIRAYTSIDAAKMRDDFYSSLD